MTTRPSCVRRGQRGFALLEALVAFAVMALGVLGAIALQSTLRYSGDIAKQRSEATRIAQAEIEKMRAFATLSTYEGIESRSDGDVDDRATNTRYTLATQVHDFPGMACKSVSVTVRWPDRQGTLHDVVLHTVIAGIDPALSGLMSMAREPAPAEYTAGSP
jgi:type IV pilus modification protein PilV